MRLAARPEIATRLFIVGCPRSGTTLVQAMLSAHPDLVSFPESNYLNAVIGDFQSRVLGRPEPSPLRALRTGLRIRLGLANRAAVPHFAKTMQILGRPDLAPALRHYPVSIARAARTLIGALDRIALDRGHTRWVEKSPTHYAYLEYLERYCPDVRILHVLRPGEDVVASLQDAALRYPGTFWQRDFSDVNDCIRCWNGALRSTLAHLSRPGHRILRFDALLADPAGNLAAVCNWLGLPYAPAMLSEYGTQTNALRVPRETWKDGVAEHLHQERKFLRLFTRQEQDRIRTCLLPLPESSDV